MVTLQIAKWPKQSAGAMAATYWREHKQRGKNEEIETCRERDSDTYINSTRSERQKSKVVSLHNHTDIQAHSHSNI